MRREFEGETNPFFAYVTPSPSLLVSQELNTVPPILLTFIHLAMRIIINETLLPRD